MTTTNASLQRLTKPLPSSEDAERAIIGGILTDNRLIVEAQESLSAGDFYSRTHGVIFTAMLELYASNKQIDPILIGELLKRDGLLESVGGVTAVTNTSFGLPYFETLAEYIAIVREKSVVRQVISACSSIQSDALSEDLPAWETLSRASSAIQDIADRYEANGKVAEEHDLTELANESLKAAESYHTRRDKLVSSGLTDLDRLLGGGFEPGTLAVIGARPSAGKSALALQIAAASAERNLLVLVNSLEMRRRDCMDRLIASEARVNLQDFRTGELVDFHKEKAQTAARKIGKLPIVIDDRPMLTPALLRSRSNRIRTRRRRLDLVILDYLQLMRSDGRASHQDNRRLEIEAYTRGLKLLAMELNVPLICLSQLSRAPSTRKDPRPILSDLRESGSIEQDADLVILIHQPENDDPTELIVAKNRNGPTGTVKVCFFGSSTRFENLAGGSEF